MTKLPKTSQNFEPPTSTISIQVMWRISLRLYFYWPITSAILFYAEPKHFILIFLKILEVICFLIAWWRSYLTALSSATTSDQQKNCENVLRRLRLIFALYSEYTTKYRSQVQCCLFPRTRFRSVRGQSRTVAHVQVCFWNQICKISIF